MPLRIAFDMDGVLADMESELARQAEILFGERLARREQACANNSVAVPEGVDAATDGPATADTQRQAAAETAPDNVRPLAKLNLTARQQKKLWRHVESIENFWQTVQEIEPRVIERIGALARDRRWEIIFLTKRPETVGSTAQVQSQRWLESRGFPLPSVYVVQGSRGRIAAALGLDIVVDDRPENCLDVVVDSKARAILVWRDVQKPLPVAARTLGIGVVKSVAECLDVLTQIDSPDRNEPGVIDRVKKLLGLKPSAANV
jgi:hypothetical protein